MKMRSLMLTTLITSVGLAGSAAAAVVFTSVGSFPGLSGTDPIKFEGTTDTGNQLSHATFSSAVTTAFANNIGGVLDYELANEKNLSGAQGVLFGVDGRYKLGLEQVFDTTGTSGRTPTSGDRITTFGSASPTISLGSIYNSSGSVISGVGVTQVGFAILSRSDYAANVQVTANFSGGGSELASRLLGSSADGGENTFFGFIAPDGQTISSLAFVFTQSPGGTNNAFMGLDDFGFVTNIPEPGITVLGGLGILTLLRRRRRIEP